MMDASGTVQRQHAIGVQHGAEVNAANLGVQAAQGHFFTRSMPLVAPQQILLGRRDSGGVGQGYRCGQLCGAQRGFTDAAILPFVRQFAAIDTKWFAVQPIPYLKAWLADHLTSTLFQTVMVRVTPWSPA